MVPSSVQNIVPSSATTLGEAADIHKCVITPTAGDVTLTSTFVVGGASLIRHAASALQMYVGRRRSPKTLLQDVEVEVARGILQGRRSIPLGTDVGLRPPSSQQPYVPSSPPGGLVLDRCQRL